MFLPKDSKLAALSALARTMIEKRGRLDNRDVDQFIAAGFGKDHALEVIAIVAASTITTYTGSVTKIPLEAPFQAHAFGRHEAGVAHLDMPPTSPPVGPRLVPSSMRASRAPEPSRVSRGPRISRRLASGVVR
jgi:hypothetical protein